MSQMNYTNTNNLIVNNTLDSNNGSGIDLYGAHLNKFINNVCSKNKFGIIQWDSNNNTYSDNIISDSFQRGVWLLHNCDNNCIFHNNIISNIKQAVDDGNNIWNNSQQEGNYWSDYTGLDNGANGRVAGDGIGDTNIPHLGLDNYPFIEFFGWASLDTPILDKPINISIDGNYTLFWNPSYNSTGYKLEEDDNIFFNSPIEIYNGPGLSLQFKNKANGTYYYRVKAYNNYLESEWSDIVDIIVDWLPSAPTGLIAQNSGGHTVLLSWNPNPEPDIIGYHVFINDTEAGLEGPFNLVESIIGLNTIYQVTNLFEETIYYFRVKAYDKINSNSSYSNFASITTLDVTAPRPPTEFNVTYPTSSSLTLTWQPSLDYDVVGYHIYRALTETGTFTRINDRPLTELTYTNINLEEVTTYYYKVTAVDEVPNESEFSELASGITLLGPYAPDVNNSLADFKIVEDAYDDKNINLHYWFKDVNNDPLAFRCENTKHIQVIIYQDNGTVILIPEKNWNGQEKLKFLASDGAFEIYDDVIITVTPVNDPPEQGEIISPDNGTEADYGKTLDFKAKCEDPDLPYGDELTFLWSSNISGEIGEGDNLSSIILPIGDHLITLEVSDKYPRTCVITIHVIVIETPKSDSDGDGMPNIWEREHGFDPLDPSDAVLDLDNDGKTNFEEYLLGTNPNMCEKPKENISDSEKDNENLVMTGMIIIIIVIVLVIIILTWVIIVRKKKSLKNVEKQEIEGMEVHPERGTPIGGLLQPQEPPQYILQTQPLQEPKQPVQSQTWAQLELPQKSVPIVPPLRITPTPHQSIPIPSQQPLVNSQTPTTQYQSIQQSPQPPTTLQIQPQQPIHSSLQPEIELKKGQS